MTMSSVLKLIHTATLPGPDRQRTPKLYRYHLLYQEAEPVKPGCVRLWEVVGGRETYQIAIEREESGTIRYHCTCADAVFRGETQPDHVCKHVKGFLQTLKPQAA